MRKICYLSLLAAVVFTSCQDNKSFKKGKQGIEYKIISGNGSEKVKPGEFMQLHVGQYYSTQRRDSLLSDTRTTGGPYMEALDSASTPPQYYEILSQLKKGDSLVLRIPIDSAFAKSPMNMPPWMKKGNFLTTTVKVINIFNNIQSADSARTAEMRIIQVRDSIKGLEMQAKDNKTLEAYFSKNNIKTVKGPQGTFVEILQPGTGAMIDTSVIVAVKYTGKLFSNNEIFDSNVDTTNGHGSTLEPLKVNMTNDRTLGISVIKGWMDGLTLLNKGAKARFYIPSNLAYGSRDNGKIPSNSILVFDVEISDIFTKEQERALRKERMEKVKAMQKVYADSISKAKAKMDTTKKK
ncbi:MAG: FKBP-type peptidyl-prolyl cis-trans isomerase [Bacteroidetes bacterium]|nr:FKBP-type peptidyl-prolyl cis-trans isomerase [Bacteroidota bacterium]